MEFEYLSCSDSNLPTTSSLTIISYLRRITDSIGHMTNDISRFYDTSIGGILLEALFESDKKEKILFFLYSHEQGYAREIARIFRFNLNTVQNQLLNLESHGVLYSQLKGKVRIFGFNPRYPFRKELEALLNKAMAFLPEDEVRKYYRPRLRPRRTGKPL